jgi:hypothetical protein
MTRKRILDRGDFWIINEYFYDDKNREHHKCDSVTGLLPDVAFAINDSMALNVEYFQDGGFHICTYGFNRANECKHADILAATIVFDTLYRTKMEGSLQIICDSNTITDAFTNEEMIKVVHRERQVGMWRTYNLNNYKIDSAIYKPE